MRRYPSESDDAVRGLAWAYAVLTHIETGAVGALTDAQERRAKDLLRQINAELKRVRTPKA